MNIKNLTLIFLTLTIGLGLSSCRRQKSKTQIITATEPKRGEDPVKAQDKIVQTPEVPIVIATIPVFKKLDVSNTDFVYLNTKSKIVAKTESGEQNVNVTIRIKKDSIIWLSAGLMGIEGVRAIITVDSIKFIDKINKKAYAFDFIKMSKQFNFDMNFKLIQSIIVGNMPIEQSQLDQVLAEGIGQIIRQQREPVIIDNFIETNKLKRIKVLEQKGNSMDIQYTDFQAVNASVLPFSSNTNISFIKDGKASETRIAVQHQKVEMPIEPLLFPFNVPSNYQKKDF